MAPEEEFWGAQDGGFRLSNGFRWFVIITSWLAALGTLAFVLLVAIYALNVGTIWSSQGGEEALLTIRNESRSTVSVLHREPDGFTRKLTAIAPGGEVVVPLKRCLSGSLSALNARGGVEGTLRSACRGDLWKIEGR